ncbi:MAG: type I DNA topoisomerase [Patescibacteria group bacterium]|nr:type I DNA topoisomerase [Patescibacteria group bacterium]
MELVIVESPTKAKTISKFVKKGYTIESSYGHIRDLPKSKLGIDVDHNFEPQYIIPTKAKKNVTKLKKLAQKADKVILATDEDREGEAIAWHLAHALGIDETKTERIVFHEITKSAIKAALEHPRTINLALVNAQQGRRVLDRLVGYKLSPFLWKKIARGLSAGRVQSVAVRFVVEREEEIKKFVPEEYWTLGANLLTPAQKPLQANLSKIDNESVERFTFRANKDIGAVTDALAHADFTVANVEKKELKRNPLPPFTTSTLQQTSSKRLGFSAKKTMLLAQRLYERGLITYMRTDSVNLSKESLAAAQTWLTKNLGEEYALPTPRTFTTKSRLAQEAHEAIRPTDIANEPDSITAEDPGEKKLYNMIWSRFTATQMPQAEFHSSQIDISASGGGHDYLFRANGTMLKFDGFLKVWKQKFVETELPEVAADEKLSLQAFAPEQHFTEPPPRFNEASLIKALEEHGIGRPSTYAPTLSVIQSRNYVIKEGGRFVPTDIGIIVTNVLKEHFPQIVDINFTATMENELDEIAEGSKDWHDIIRNFYGPFEKNLEEKYKVVEKTQQPEPEPTGVVCEKCGKPMIIKFSRFGRFMACSGFPDCKNTKKIPSEQKKIGLVCPKCGKGDVIERRVTRGRARGKIFWGCNRYPDCDYASWTNPLNPPEEKKPKEAESAAEPTQEKAPSPESEPDSA